MYFKVLSLFLVIQFVSYGLWYGVQARHQKPDLKPVSQTMSAPQAVIVNSAKEQYDLSHVRFAARTEDKGYRLMNADKKQELASVLHKLPTSHTGSLRNLILDYDPKAHRGLGGRQIIILRAVNMEAEERIGVLIHEIGHVVDLGKLTESEKKKRSEFNDGKKPVYEGDPSLNFYRINWKDDKNRKKTAGNLDFVSGYAMSDPFEDFAETYVYYVLHNKDFKSKTHASNALYKKYQFMKEKVFNGMEFDTGDYVKTDDVNRRPWDITVLSYDLQKFLST